jgi:hypothetical protein
MGEFIKKLQAHDSKYNDFFKNQLGKAYNTVDISPQDTTISKKSEDNRQLQISFGSIENNPNNTRTEKIVVSAVPGADFATKKDFLAFVSSQISGTFSTHDIETILPYRSQENNQAHDFYSLKSKYNYYSEGYETQTQNVSERIIPNYYVQKTDLELQKSNFNNPQKQFFEAIGKTTSMTLPPINNEKLRNIIVDNLDSIESQAAEYPMYNEIKFVSSKVGNLTNFLNKYELTPLLISDFSNPLNLSKRQFNILTAEKNSTVQEDVTLGIFNLDTWIQNQLFELSTTNITVLSGYENSSFYSDRLKKYIINGILRTYTERYLRTYEQVYNSDPCYTEVLFYKVDKYVNNIIGDPVQTYWVSNKDELNILLDTQIKYGSPYSYDVKQVIMVMGNAYSFGKPELRPEGKQFQADIEILNRPSIQVLEIPYFSNKIVSIQSPPLRPQVHFSTKMNSEQQIKISLSHTVGEEIEKFTQIETSDLQQLNRMMLFSPNYTSVSGEYYFQSAAVPEYFEIYRLDSKPKSYADFSANKLKDAKSFFQEKRQSSSHVSVNDSVRPNRKYYYMFRSVNIHNDKSNPTIVYEVELIQDADDSKIVVSQFQFETPPTFDNAKKFNSLFQIDPALQQRLLDNNQPSLYNKPSAKGTLDQIKLGNVEDSIWGRTFKIRITSTTTGKKIDFNVNFNIITSKTEEDFE